jgi:hypothetical protein
VSTAGPQDRAQSINGKILGFLSSHLFGPKTIPMQYYHQFCLLWNFLLSCGQIFFFTRNEKKDWRTFKLAEDGTVGNGK